MKEVKCLACSNEMQFFKQDKIQLGQTGWLTGDISNLLSGALEVDIYICQNCGRLEFYQRGSINNNEGITQIKCPNCGQKHDIDYPKCPFCKHNYNK